MIAENYFGILSTVYGLIMVLKIPAVHLFPEKWNKFELGVAYTEKQPFWVWLVGLAGISLVGFTWYEYVVTDVPYSLVITIVITLTIAKLAQVLFNYQRFRKFVINVTTRNRSAFGAMNVVTALVGIALVLLGIFVY